MLDTILPKFAPSMDSILATQTFLVHFLPVSHCQKWLPLSKFDILGLTDICQCSAYGTVSTVGCGTTKLPT